MTSEKSKQIGVLGEDLAVRFLRARGLRIVERNVFVDRDEIDIVYERDGSFFVVEVKTSSNDDDPLEAFGETKMRRVARAVSGYRLPIAQVDAIAVKIGSNGIEVRWLRGIA